MGSESDFSMTHGSAYFNYLTWLSGRNLESAFIFMTLKYLYVFLFFIC